MRCACTQRGTILWRTFASSNACSGLPYWSNNIEGLSTARQASAGCKAAALLQLHQGAVPKASVLSQGVNHHYTREERLRLADVDGIDYLPPNSAVFRRWLAKQPHRHVPAAPLV